MKTIVEEIYFIYIQIKVEEKKNFAVLISGEILIR